MPAEMPLSMTALGSWCVGDSWIMGLPVDEAVPMLFQMGQQGKAFARRLQRGADWVVPMARHSYGVATDEPIPALRRGRRIYVFHSGTWMPEDWARISAALP
jgi:hypothetical protein